MAKKKQYFFFDRIRSTADRKKEIVVQGYAVDGYLEDLKPRAAIFDGDQPVKALKCRLVEVKLPPIHMRRRHGDTISYLGVIYVDLSDMSDERLKKLERAKLVVVGEKPDGKRAMLYKGTVKKVVDTLEQYSFIVDDAYCEDGKTHIGGWLSGGKDTTIKIVSEDSDKPLDYKIDYIPRDDVLMEYPELDDDSEMGIDIILAGEYKKLQMTLSDRNRKSTKSVTVGKADKDFSSLGTVGRYSEKVVRNLKNYGLRETVAKVKVHLSPNYFNLNKKYEKYIKNVSPSAAELSEQRKLQKNFSFRPLMSFLVPLYETEEVFLAELIAALKAQTYPEWEVCFSDGSKDPARLTEIIKRLAGGDERIRYVADIPGPLGISSNTNQAFSIAKGDFIVLGDHDDLITPDALYECVKAMNEDDSIDVIYTDEDKTNSTGKKRFEPNLKPDFNQELLESCNYITHMFVARKSLVDEVGLFDDTYNGAQDYDFILRCTEKARKIRHIPKVVYSWRINDTSTAGNPAAKMYAYDAGVKALQAHYDRLGIKATAEVGDHLGYYHSIYPEPVDTFTYIAVLNASDEVKYNETVESINSKSDYKQYEFIRINPHEGEELPKQMNRAVKQICDKLAGGESKELSSKEVYVCFIEAGITMMGEDGISNMLAYIAAKPNVAAIGGKIYIPGGTVSHAGTVINIQEIEGWMYTRQSVYDEMYFNYGAYTALRRGVNIFRLDDLKKYGKFDTEYRGENAVIDYTYQMTMDGRVCIYDANANFQYKPARGRDGETCFETLTAKRRDSRIFLGKHPEVTETGDKYYSQLVK